MFVMLSTVTTARAGVSDFRDYFEIDLENDTLPTLQELDKALENVGDYNSKYDSFYDLLGSFDTQFYLTIAAYGGREKRLKTAEEDAFLEMLAMTPVEQYQYIGPALFEVPTMSEKILNLPGIKETKNKFPTRIAEQLKDIDNIEFLSPSLYFLLMPELWSGYRSEAIEYPKKTPYYPKIKYNPKFYAMIRQLVKPEKYMPGYKKPTGRTKSDLHTLKPTKETLLTSADVQSFMATIDAVDDWTQKPENKFALSTMTIKFVTFDREDPIGQYVPSGLQDLVNPCRRLVQKTRVLGKELELAKLVAPQGFTLNEWAYTCDKTIKAYRLSKINTGMVQTLLDYQHGVYEQNIPFLRPQTQNTRFATMQGILSAYTAPMSDVLEVKKNRTKLQQYIEKHNYSLFGYPIIQE
jgi:hypothetical protein